MYKLAKYFVCVSLTCKLRGNKAMTISEVDCHDWIKFTGPFFGKDANRGTSRMVMQFVKQLFFLYLKHERGLFPSLC